MESSEDYNGQTFAQLFKKHYYCPEFMFSSVVFMLTAYRVALPLSFLILLGYRRYFRQDLALIQKLGQCTMRQSYYDQVVQLHRKNDIEINTRRVRWKLRVSGRKLLALEARLLKRKLNFEAEEQMNRSFV